MIRSFLILLILIWTSNAYSQEYKRDNIWMLGAFIQQPDTSAGIDFNNGIADTFSLVRSLSMDIANASICDTNGQLLFYTNADQINNSKHQLMSGTSNFNPGYYTNFSFVTGSKIFQSVLILPVPEQPNLYMLIHESADSFTISPYFFVKPMSLRYSIVDMNLDSGYGQMTIKNQIIIDDTLLMGRLTACKHGNGRDWWIIAHEAASNKFLKILLTNDTILVYNEQQIGDTIYSKYQDNFGAGHFNSNGDKFAYLNYDTTLYIYDFDRCSGQFSNLIKVYFSDTINAATLSCAFSRSGRYLYVNNNYHIFQLDMNSTNIPASKTIVATWNGSVSNHGYPTKFYILNLAPDYKIYISTYDGTNIFHVINSPDSSGISCNVVQSHFFLPTYNVFGMPNAVNYALGPLQGSSCDSINIGMTELNQDNNEIILFPNPASSKIHIEVRNHFENGLIQIYDAVGKVVLSKELKGNENPIVLEISDLYPGLYYVSFQFADRRMMSKFVKTF